MSKGPRGRTLAQCDVCRLWYHRDEMRRMPHDSGLPWGHANYLDYSNYNSAYWGSSASDCGAISMGSSGDYRVFLDMATNAPTIINGSQTWLGPGWYFSHGVGNDIDASTWDRICFWFAVGAYEQDAQALTVDLGIWSPSYPVADPGHAQIFQTISFLGSQRCWFSVTADDLNATGVPASSFYIAAYIYAAADQRWWADNAQIDRNLTYPEGHIRTAGKAVIYDPSTFTPAGLGPRTAVVVCPNCADPTEPRAHGPARREVEPPIPLTGSKGG